MSTLDDLIAGVRRAIRGEATLSEVARLLAAYEKAPPLIFPEKMDEALADILGRPNFTLGDFARAFRDAGEPIPRKAEAEQAFMLHWMTCLYLRHGEKWHDEGGKIIDALIAKIKARQAEANAVRESAAKI